MTISAHDVAAALIERQLAAGRSIDKMQLQKLLYLVHGVHYACWGVPAFREPIDAYRNGPVVRVVEQTYRNATVGTAPLSGSLGGHPERLPFETADTVETILRYYGTWTGPHLEDYTKRPGSPWQQARGDLPPGASSSINIPPEAIAAWFDRHGVDPGRPEQEHWDATEVERRAADERIQAANRHGVFAPGVTPEIEAATRRVLARLATNPAEDS